jgi:hypothetical protein
MTQPIGPDDITEAMVAEAWELRRCGTSTWTIAEKMGLTERAVDAALTIARARYVGDPRTFLARVVAQLARDQAYVDAELAAYHDRRRRRPPSR